jgi:hypothetical protein
MLRHPRARSERMSSRGQLMGGTFDEVSSGFPGFSTLLAAGTVRVMLAAHARCWVLRDRMCSSEPTEPQDLFWRWRCWRAERVPPVL